MELATKNDIERIYEFYKQVIEHVNQTDIKLGWNINSYPDIDFIAQSVKNAQMFIIKKENDILAAAVVNHTVNKEYDDINWQIKGPKEKVSTIHALAVSPKCRGKATSDIFLKQIEDMCKANGDVAIHLDVIDTNIPAYKLYVRNGYTECDCIKMYYEVVGTREFWMMEKTLEP